MRLQVTFINGVVYILNDNLTDAQLEECRHLVCKMMQNVGCKPPRLAKETKGKLNEKEYKEKT